MQANQKSLLTLTVQQSQRKVENDCITCHRGTSLAIDGLVVVISNPGDPASTSSLGATRTL